MTTTSPTPTENADLTESCEDPRGLAEWLVALDDPHNVEARGSVSLQQIIDRARASIAVDDLTDDVADAACTEIEAAGFVRAVVALAEVAAERRRQDEKWGEQNHPNVDQVLMTRAGGCTPQRMAENYEIPTASRAKFITDTAAARGQCTYAAILVEEVAEAVEAATLEDGTLRDELLQVAAVAVAWVEKLDREAAATYSGSGQ